MTFENERYHNAQCNFRRDKPLLHEFDRQDSSVSGGALMRKACDRNLGLMDAKQMFS